MFSLQSPAGPPTNQKPEARELVRIGHPISLVGTEEGEEGGVGKIPTAVLLGQCTSCSVTQW